MAQFDVKIEGLDTLVRHFKKAPQITEPIFQKAIEASQFVLQKHNLKDNPTPWRTGNLLQSFNFEMGRLYGRYYPTAHYALAVHEGHKQTPGRFVPAIGKRLVQDYVPGNPFMPKIAERAQPEINDLMLEAANMIGEEIAKI